MSNIHDESDINVPDDLLATSLPACTGSYRSLSAKRSRDPSHRKSVSFNDVPIVHEVPSHDTMRNSNSNVYRSWTHADASVPFSSSQILLPLNSTSAAAQKIHTNRLSNTLYSSTNNPALNRLSDWHIRAKTLEETTEHNTTSNPPLIIFHAPEERIIQNSSKTQQIASHNGEEKKHLYRPAIIPDNEHYRSLPFAYAPSSESNTNYTSMLTTNLIQSNKPSPNGHTRTIRARSAILQIPESDSSTRNNDNISITSFRTITNGSSSRTILKPATIAFHGSTNSPILITTNASTAKPPTIPPRLSSFAAHSRLISSSNRPLLSTNKNIAPSTALPRSRSPNILSSKRNTTSSVGMPDGQSGGTKHNSHVRQTYGSYYIHDIFLPTNIN
jgi:hypothetical protein